MRVFRSWCLFILRCQQANWKLFIFYFWFLFLCASPASHHSHTVSEHTEHTEQALTTTLLFSHYCHCPWCARMHDTDRAKEKKMWKKQIICFVVTRASYGKKENNLQLRWSRSLSLSHFSLSISLSLSFFLSNLFCCCCRCRCATNKLIRGPNGPQRKIVAPAKSIILYINQRGRRTNANTKCNHFFILWICDWLLSHLSSVFGILWLQCGWPHRLVPFEASNSISLTENQSNSSNSINI